LEKGDRGGFSPICIGAVYSEEHMTKEDLLAILKKLLRTERSLDFLNGLDEEDVRTLIVCIRDRLDRESRDH
jgi:hypothetical protein